MLRLLHCSDLHLDEVRSPAELEAPDAAFAALREAFGSMLAYAKENEVSLILLSGDLFSHRTVTSGTLDFLKKGFASIPAVQIAIAPGSTDPFTADSVWNRVTFSPNVHIFRSPLLERIALPEIGADLYGFAHSGVIRDDAVLPSRFHVTRPERFNLFVGYAETEPGRGLPILKPDNLLSAGIDYAALGSRHNAGKIRKVARDDGTAAYFGYAGCFAGRDETESGEKGAVQVELSKTDGFPTRIAVRRLRFTRTRYLRAEVSLEGCSSQAEAANRIRDAFEAGGGDAATCFSAELTGCVRGAFLPDPERIRPLLPAMQSLTLRDRTTVDPAVWKLRADADPTLRGAFREALAPLLDSDDAEKRETAILALRLGISALETSSDGV